MIYILNSFSVPVNYDEVSSVLLKIERVSVDEARSFLRDKEFQSAIGHESTARLLSELLGVKILPNRVSIHMHKHDIGIHFVIARRLKEGEIISYEELSKEKFFILKSTVLEST